MVETFLSFSRRVVGALVDHPEFVEVYVDEAGRDWYRIRIGTGPGELGQVIGREGRNLAALRALVQAVGGKHQCAVDIELLESGRDGDGARSGTDRGSRG